MAFFTSAISTLQTLVVALGAGLGVWGVINLLEGYGNDNPGAKSQGMKQLMAGAQWGRRGPHRHHPGSPAVRSVRRHSLICRHGQANAGMPLRLRAGRPWLFQSNSLWQFAGWKGEDHP